MPPPPNGGSLGASTVQFPDSGCDRCIDDHDRTFEFNLLGWNVGGCDITDLQELLREGRKAPIPGDAILALQELPRGKEGWSKQFSGQWSVVQFRHENAWRGVGIAFRQTEWAVAKKTRAGRGLWVQLKHIVRGCRVWVGAAHFTPGCSLAHYETEIEQVMLALPRLSGPTVFQCDANAPYQWGTCEGVDQAVGRDAKAVELQGMLQQRGFALIPPVVEQFRTPTSRPRQQGRTGNCIDVMACKGLVRGRLRVHVDSYMVLGTDHEIVEGSFQIRPKQERVRRATGPRVWAGGIERVGQLDQETLVDLAHRCTKPKPGCSYRDPPAVKEAARRARVAKTGAAWNQVRRLRKQARRDWEVARIARASSGDWAAFRASKPQADTGWIEGFAQVQQIDPHEAVHDHLTRVYKGEPPQPNDGVYSGEVSAFTEEELDRALGQLQSGKSVGCDGTSKELLMGLASVEGGKQHLLEFMTRVLTTQDIPVDWNTPLMIMLPKTSQPLTAKDLRPISMGSGACKLFSRLLLNRCLDSLSFTTHSQCAGPGRQTTDYLFTSWRLLELEREWRRGLCMAKLDITKAFDMVSREKVLSRLQAKLGDSAEMRCWRGLLQQNDGCLQTPWGSSMVCMQRGIKQGAVESPILFALVAEFCLAEAATRFRWRHEDVAFQGMEHHDMLYMDDCLLWGRGVEGLEIRIKQLGVVLAEFGLSLNGAKSQVYTSPFWEGPKYLTISGVRVDASDHIEIMGLRMRVGMSLCELIGPLLTRSKSKFWSQKHLFRSHTPLKGRLRLLERVAGGSAMWCLAAFPPDRSALGLINSCHVQMVTWTMQLGKQATESWELFHKRAFRCARAALCNAGLDRWGTTWIRRWWGFSGHRARGLLRPVPAVSSCLDAFRTLEWWEYEKRKKDGLQHTHHYPRLMNMERIMNKAAGNEWRVVAQDRSAWKGREQGFVDLLDLPWSSGRQTQILNFQ